MSSVYQIFSGIKSLVISFLVVISIFFIGTIIQIVVSAVTNGAWTTTISAICFTIACIAITRNLFARGWMPLTKQDSLPFNLKPTRHFGTGFGMGLVAILLLIILSVSSGMLRFTGLNSKNFSKYFLYVFLYLILAICIGLTEELIFRGYLLQSLNRIFPFWLSTILSTIAFDASHLSLYLPTLVTVSLLGILFCLMVRIYQDLWWVVGFHSAWDWGLVVIGLDSPGAGMMHLKTSNLFSYFILNSTWIWCDVSLVIISILVLYWNRKSIQF